jgi:hypothetical protein
MEWGNAALNHLGKIQDLSCRVCPPNRYACVENLLIFRLSMHDWWNFRLIYAV